MAAVPPAARRWLTSNYGAAFHIADEWLEGCWAYVAEQHGTIQVQLKALDEQIRLASLETTIETPVLPAEVYEHDAQHPQDIRIATDAPMLLEIVELTEIGHSANNLRDVHEERKEERRIERAGGDVANARVARLDAGGNENASGVHELPADGEEERQRAPRFPRAMLRFRLSDGHNVVPAIEYRRIAGLSLDDTPLGCKLLVKNVRVLRGILLLEPACVTVKGGQVADLVEQSDAIFESDLRARLGEPDPAPAAERLPTPPPPAAPAPPPAPRRPPAPVTPAARPAPPARRPPAPEPDEFDDDMDVDEALLAQAAEEVERRSSASPTVKSSSADGQPRAFRGTSKYEEARSAALARLAASRAAKAKAAAPVKVDSDSSGGKAVAVLKKRPAEPIELSSD